MLGLFDSRRYLIPFRSSLLPQIFTDTLVIGGGVGGLRAALAAAEHGEVIVLLKDDPANTNTAWAQGGIAVVLDQSDTLASHVEDTLEAGADLCDVPAVKTVVEGGPPRIRELIEWGMRLDHAPGETQPSLGREGRASRGTDRACRWRRDGARADAVPVGTRVGGAEYPAVQAVLRARPDHVGE